MWDAPRPDGDAPESPARVLVVEGWPEQPVVTLNGEPAAVRRVADLGEGAWALLLPGSAELPDAASIRQRLETPE